MDRNGTVPGPRARAALAALGLPAAGGASATFTARARFSEDAAVSCLALRDEAPRVTDGHREAFRRIGGRNDLWEMEIEPDSNAAATLEPPATTDCDAADAVCAADESPLSAGIEPTAPGPVPGGSAMDRPRREYEEPPRDGR